jgi:Zn-dependent protease with chaperone function
MTAPPSPHPPPPASSSAHGEVASTPLAAELYDGLTPLARDVQVVLSEGHVRIEGEVSELVPESDVLVSPRVGRARRFITLPGGKKLSCDDSAELDRLPQEEPSEGPIAWLERRPPVSVLAIAIVFLLAVVLERVAVPAMAELVAKRIPLELEQELGRDGLEWLDEYAFASSAIELARTDAIRRKVRELAGPEHTHLRVEFRSLGDVANAFALPGGTIVLSDAVVQRCSAEQVLAIAAHEIGHLEGRHTMRQALASAGTGALVAALVGDAASLTVALSSVPSLLADLEHSREFEEEADERALELLARQGIAPSVFADALACITRDAPKDEEDESWSYLSSHPATADRIARARARGPRQ